MRNGDAECVAVRDKQSELAVTSRRVHGGLPQVVTGNRSIKIRDIGGNGDKCAVNTSDHGDETQSEPAAANPPVDVDRSKVDTINLWNCMYASFN